MSFPKDDDDEKGTTGTGSGIQYADIFAVNTPQRDDLLPEMDIKHNLAIHKDNNLSLVKKQHDTLKEREAMKSGKRLSSAEQYQINYARGGGGGQFKQHWVHTKMHGRDRQTNPVPTEYNANTNENELKNKLENRPKMQPRREPPRPRPL